jgi:hypothetical protein
MYAQLIEGGTTSGRRAELDRIVTDELIPALETEPGYAGALNLPDNASGDGLTIVLFRTEAQARDALTHHAPAFERAGRRLVSGCVGQRH